VSGEDDIDVSSVRCCAFCIKNGETISDWRAHGGPSSTAAKPECKQNADVLIRNDRDGRDRRIGCYCYRERTWLQRNARISHRREQRSSKVSLCRSHNIIPTAAQQLHAMVTCDAHCTFLPFLGHFQRGTEQIKMQCLEVITEISRNTVKTGYIKMVKNFLTRH